MRLREFVLLLFLAELVGFGMARGGGPIQATWERQGGGTGGTIPVGPPGPRPMDGVEGGGILPPPRP